MILRRHAYLLGFLVGVVLGGAVTTAAPAQANSFGPPFGFLYADSQLHTYSYFHLTDRGNLAFDHAFAWLDGQTDMGVSGIEPATEETDVLAKDARLGDNGPRARWDCVLISGSLTTCRAGDATLNIDVLDPQNNKNWKKSAYHEVGHSTGLDHAIEATNTCMKTGAVLNDDMLYLNGHDVEHINGKY